MQWWCSSSSEPWSWAWQAYPGVWLATAAIAALYFRRWRQRRPPVADAADGGRSDRRAAWWFGLGVFVTWLASDWPLGALGAGYLASVHMAQFMLYTLVAAPLLLLGIPAWMVSANREGRVRRVLRVLSRPVWAGITFNVLLIITHAPVVVDPARATQVGSLVMDVVWLAAGLILWMPLLSPARELRTASPAVRCVYLFVACGVLPMLPGAFLVFADYPLYGTFELAPRVTSLSARDDQQVAGLIMKLANIPVVWPVLAVLFFRWASSDGQPGASVRPAPVPAGSTREADSLVGTPP